MRKVGTILSSNYITCKLVGRTGNMMFEIAHSYVKSLEYNRQLVIPSRESSPLSYRNTLFRKIDFSIDQTPSPEEVKHVYAPFTFAELKPEENSPTVFVGYYQSEKYFGKYTEAVKNLFSPPIEFVNKALIDYPFLKHSTVAAINVRRGDYLEQSRRHPVVSIEYVEEAIKHLPNYDYLLVTSDDMTWCRENIKGPKVIYNDPTRYWDHEGIWLLSLCDHFIISNSTHSWWGAWLSRSENKTVIAPETWFGPEIGEDPKDLYCDSWIKLPTEFKDNYIVPKK